MLILNPKLKLSMLETYQMNGMTDVSEAKKGLRKAGRQILNCGTSEN